MRIVYANFEPITMKTKQYIDNEDGVINELKLNRISLEKENENDIKFVIDESFFKFGPEQYCKCEIFITSSNQSFYPDFYPDFYITDNSITTEQIHDVFKDYKGRILGLFSAQYVKVFESAIKDLDLNTYIKISNNFTLKCVTLNKKDIDNLFPKTEYLKGDDFVYAMINDQNLSRRRLNNFLRIIDEEIREPEFLAEYLTDAIRSNNINAVKFVLSRGANINLDSDYNYPIDIAIGENNYDMVKFLLDNGAKIIEDEYVESSILIHCLNIKVNIKIIELLLENGVNPNGFDNEVLLFAKNDEMRQLLIDHGANVQLTINKNSDDENVELLKDFWENRYVPLPDVKVANN